MRLFAQVRSCLKWLMNRSQMESAMESEVDFHIESYAEDLIRDGASPQEALRRARIEFGGVESHKDAIRGSLGLRWVDDLWVDLQYAARRLRKSPGFTLAAVLVLALGIGVNVAAFSAFNTLLLKSLPVRDPETLVRLQRRSPENITSQMPYPTAIFYRDHAKTLSSVIVTMGARMEFENDIQPVKANLVTANYFTELGTTAAYGRLLNPMREGAPDAAPVVVLSFAFWQQHFGADPVIVGSIIHLNRKAAIVVGIAPYTFASPGYQYPDVWLPITQQPYFVNGSKALTDTSGGNVEMWGRLAPGVTAPVAEQELLALTNELRKQYPKDIWDHEFIKSDPGGRIQVVKPEMYQVLALVGVLTLLILAVACANLGGLLLARGVTRAHEIGIRIAIGAGKLRIVRQLFTENLLLALLGSLAGLGLGYAVLRIALAQIAAPVWISAAPDWRVFMFAAGMALVSAVFFGLAPAVQIARRRQSRAILRQVLVGAQIAASCVLLIVAGLLVRATRHVMYTDPGFGYEQVLSMDPDLAGHGYTPAAARAYLSELKDRLGAVPGVRSVALCKMAPLGNKVSYMTVDIAGRAVNIYPNWVDPEFFRTMDIPILRGRNFLPGEANAVIMSDSLARKQWPGEDPIGKRYWEKDIVVGIAGNARVNAMNDGDTTEMYWAAQAGDMFTMTLLVKTAGAPESFPPALKSIAENIDPKVFPYIRLLKGEFHRNVQQVEQAATVVSLLGISAVLLAALGLSGLVAYAVSERRKEIAIRIALGAQPGHVLSAVLGQFVWPVALGLLTGLAGAAALSQVLRRVLFGVNNLDPAGYLGGVGVMIAITIIAALLPVNRALRTDPMRALHCE